MPADSTPGSGRVLSGASLRQGVGVKPWEKALVHSHYNQRGACSAVRGLGKRQEAQTLRGVCR